MQLNTLSLTDFRLHKRRTLEFLTPTTILVGANASGKTAILEAIYLLTSGTSFRAKVIAELIAFEREFARITAVLQDDAAEQTKLQVLFTRGVLQGKKVPARTFFVNDVKRQRRRMISYVSSVLFRPEDMRLVEGSPGRRRGFLDAVLSQVSQEYERAVRAYEQTLWRRNKLLVQVRAGEQPRTSLNYWTQALLKHGLLIQEIRRQFFGHAAGVVFPLRFQAVYVPSVVSSQRQQEYAGREIAAGHTLIGPHKDDFRIELSLQGEQHDVAAYGSRGQQRLAVLWLKLCERSYIQSHLETMPLLLLDDIWSELDDDSRALVEQILPEQQAIITTTHLELAQELQYKHPQRTQLVSLV
ncbi:MAG: DNA replication/repair protein RecF [Candidatus Pacebacteria bacterium]|nr:DNA replication/repair protein RecF [Candidatus Paceibacterota bacterium]